MPTPVFDFTSRAVPAVQVGRFQPLYRGVDRWGEERNAGWGVARWSRGPGTLYEPVWTDVTCEVHEMTTDTGRRSASDQFAPATASIVASNVTGWGDGEIPESWPQFVDHFERTGPELDSSWDRWSEMAALRPAMDELVIAEAEDSPARAATVQRHPTETTRPVTPPVVLRGTYQRQSGAPTLTIGPFPAAVVDDVVWLSLVVERPIASSGGIAPLPIPDWTFVYGEQLGIANRPDAAGWAFYVYRHRITAEEAATDLAWTYPSIPGKWNYTAFVTGGVGGNPVEGIAYVGARGSSSSNTGNFTFSSSMRIPTDGCVVARIMVARPTVTLGTLPSPLVDVAQTVTSTDWDCRQFLAFDGGTSSPTQYATSAGSSTMPAVNVPWIEATPSTTLTGFHTLSIVVTAGTEFTPESVPYRGSSGNRWAIPYVGDHFVETVVSGLAAPERVWPDARLAVELYLHLVDGELTSQVAGFEYVPDWNGDAGTLTWWLRRRTADGSWAGAAFATGTVPIGSAGFPEPALLRFEADTDGTLRLSLDGALLGLATDPAPPEGQHVAIYGEYDTGSLSYGRTMQPGPIRFERVAAGSHVPNPIHLEPGALVRIGVYHQRYDWCWLFRGYCDSLTPVYDPERDDSVRIECIDALGEAGRLVIDDQQSGELEATDRVQYLLNEAEGPVELRALDDDATILGFWSDAATGTSGRVVDMLLQTAESCGGAVYGGPGNGCLVFRRKDWQGWDPDLDAVDGRITNGPTGDYAGLVVCPSGWERSWNRADMTTRVTFGSFADESEITYRDADAERRWGIERYERDLVTVYDWTVKVLAQRQLKLRGPDKFPRVEACLLDAAVDEATLDLMSTATFTKPSHYHCELHRPDGSTVFAQRMIVTGIRHVLSPSSWTCRLSLDLAAPFKKIGGQWSNPGKGRGRWGVDVWSNA